MARRQKNYHYIYKTTCIVNNKFYIGMHSTDNLEDGYLGSGKRLWNSIDFHGRENHVKEIIEFVENREELKKREKIIVNEQLLSEKLCMNIQIGGGGGFSSDEHMKKCSSAGNKAFKEKIENDPKFKEIFQKNGGNSWRKYLSKGTHNHSTFTGKKHSEESKNKMSDLKKGTGIGEKNSVYGRKWMNKKGEKPKMVKKEEIEVYLNNNWKLGKNPK